MEEKQASLVSGIVLCDTISISIPISTFMAMCSLFACSPHLTIDPKLDRLNLDSKTLAVRPSVTIQTEIPIKIRIVRLGKMSAFRHLRKRGAKSQIDLTRKGLVAMLNRLVEGALIVYEKDAAKGVDAPLPLQVLDSSHFHALLIQDLTGRQDGNIWRDPILLSKDFLHNPMSIRQVSRCHALSGIVVRKVCRFQGVSFLQ